MTPGLLSSKVPPAPLLSDRQAPGSLSPVVFNGLGDLAVSTPSFQVQDNRALGFLLLMTLELACAPFIESPGLHARNYQGSSNYFFFLKDPSLATLEADNLHDKRNRERFNPTTFA